jgi:predicted  nucleic acid-binding Zn-ribbon protein
MLDKILDRIYALEDIEEGQIKQLDSLLDMIYENIELKKQVLELTQTVENLELDLEQTNESLNDCRNKLRAIQSVISEGLNILNKNE